LIHRLHPTDLLVKESWIIPHKADKPDLVGDFADADILLGKHDTEANIAASHADSAAPDDRDGSVINRILGNVRVAVFARRGFPGCLSTD